MRFGSEVLCLMAILVNIVFADDRGILTGLIGNKVKPTTTGAGPSEPDPDCDDGCPRQYPLIPGQKNQIPYAFKRYGIVPDILDSPPKQLLEVGIGNDDRIFVFSWIFYLCVVNLPY